ncbi:CDP-alcohol phosphatidyltransferase family protein [Kitasatospora sp. NPDC056138]|uniref:CDP-alcohol phosphatidyltransferase family protein n=1 Tax=Kitasatospora sp. NPDC056138 TaxID=3345724 RepID=UPI0035E2E4B9
MALAGDMNDDSSEARVAGRGSHRRTMTLGEVRDRTLKKRDAWWTVVLVDPVATPLVRWVARHTRITPNQITWAALFLGLGSAWLFALGDRTALILGAGLYHLSFILDCMDGKLARLTGNGSIFGAWLDYVFDRIRVVICALCLMVGQFRDNPTEMYFWLAILVIFLDMIRYVNALQIYKMRQGMRKKLETVSGGSTDGVSGKSLLFMEDLLRDNPELDTAQPEIVQAQVHLETQDAEIVDLHQGFRKNFPWYMRARNFLKRHRIRTHLISGIEFQMGVFIVAPIVGRIGLVTVVVSVGLSVFELAILYKFWLSTKDFERTMADMALRKRRRDLEIAAGLRPPHPSDEPGQGRQSAGPQPRQEQQPVRSFQAEEDSPTMYLRTIR